MIIRMIGQVTSTDGIQSLNSNIKNRPNPSQMIPLDDAEFGKY